MTPSEQRSKIIDIIAKEGGITHPETIKEEDLLIEDLKVDSIDLVMIVMEIEKEFGIYISDSQMEEFKNVKDILELVRRLTTN